MKPLIIALLAGILVVSCSEERSSDSGTDSRIAIAQCLNEKLAGITSEHTELRSVFLHEVTCSPDCYHSEVESRSFMIDV